VNVVEDPITIDMFGAINNWFGGIEAVPVEVLRKPTIEVEQVEMDYLSVKSFAGTAINVPYKGILIF
jgi:hypothetical protein